MEHEILTGARGGQYWIDEKGKKHYISQQGPVAKPKTSVNRLPAPISQRRLNKTTNKDLTTYICYYLQRNPNTGDIMDNFKEWCKARNIDEARKEFEDRYWHAIEKETIEISMVIPKND